MPKTITLRPMPKGKGGWQVQVSGKRKRVFDDKQTARGYARQLKRDGDTFKVFKSNNSLQFERTVR